MPPRSAHFNPPAPCGAGLRSAPQGCGAERFQSTRPLRGGTALWVLCDIEALFQSTRPLRGGTRSHVYPTLPTQNFNPPAPCGAGHVGMMIQQNETDFNPPAPCGAGLYFVPGMHIEEDFNPPAPCGAGLEFGKVIHRSANFNPPAPCGAGLTCISVNMAMLISIHPPLAGRDHGDEHGLTDRRDFNPPAPCGAGQRDPVCRAG